MTADEREDQAYARRAANSAKGGHIRAARLSRERRIEIAKQAIATRWKKVKRGGGDARGASPPRTKVCGSGRRERPSVARAYWSANRDDRI